MLCQVSRKLSEMVNEKLQGRDKRFRENIHHAEILLNQFMSHYSGVVTGVHMQNGAFVSLRDEAEELKNLCAFILSFHNGDFQDCIIRFERLPFIPVMEEDIGGRIRTLREKFHFILEILHKLFSLFCMALVTQAQQHCDMRGPSDRQLQLAVYQRFVRQLPDHYQFKASIGEELAKTSRILSAI